MTQPLEQLMERSIEWALDKSCIIGCKFNKDTWIYELIWENHYPYLKFTVKDQEKYEPLSETFMKKAPEHLQSLFRFTPYGCVIFAHQDPDLLFSLVNIINLENAITLCFHEKTLKSIPK